MKSYKQMLEDNHYSYHKSEGYHALKMTDHLYQKRVRDRVGTLYFINAWCYPARTINGNNVPEGVQYEVQFRIGENESFEEVCEVMICDVSPDRAEAFFDKIWTRMRWKYYERY